MRRSSPYAPLIRGRFALIARVLVLLPILCLAARAEIAVTNLKDGETLRYPVALLRGTAAGAGALSVANADNARPDGKNEVPIVDGRFVALIELVPGANRLELASSGQTSRLAVSYKPMATAYRVNVVMVTAEDGDATYMTFFEKDPQNYVEKLDAAAKLLQTIAAECMHDAGCGA